MNPPYQNETVLTYLRAFSVVSRAFVGNPGNTVETARENGAIELSKEEVKELKKNTPELTRENFNPQVGDSLFINFPGQHISTIVEILPEECADDCVTYISCDGGQQVVTGDKPCCSIRLVKRKAIWAGKKLVDRFKSDREVTWLVQRHETALSGEDHPPVPEHR